MRGTFIGIWRNSEKVVKLGFRWHYRHLMRVRVDDLCHFHSGTDSLQCKREYVKGKNSLTCNQTTVDSTHVMKLAFS